MSEQQPRPGMWPGAFESGREALQDLPDPPDDDRPLAARIAAVIAQAIDDRVYRQGQRLPPAAAIGRRFGTSVDTARAALRALIAQGYARRETGGASYVRGRPR